MKTKLWSPQLPWASTIENLTREMYVGGVNKNHTGNCLEGKLNGLPSFSTGLQSQNSYQRKKQEKLFAWLTSNVPSSCLLHWPLLLSVLPSIWNSLRFRKHFHRRDKCQWNLYMAAVTCSHEKAQKQIEIRFLFLHTWSFSPYDNCFTLTLIIQTFLILVLDIYCALSIFRIQSCSPIDLEFTRLSSTHITEYPPLPNSGFLQKKS